MVNVTSAHSTKRETVRFIILQIVVLVLAFAVACDHLRIRNVVDWATIDVHLLLLVVLFTFSVKLLHRRPRLSVCGFVVLFIGIMVCDRAYGGAAHIFILLPFAASLVVYTLASKRLLPKRRLVAGLISLAILSNCAFRSSAALESMFLTVDHGRFVKHVFWQLSELPSSEIPPKLRELSNVFMFPSKQSDDPSSPESQRILKIYGLDYDSIHLTTNGLTGTNDLSILTNANRPTNQSLSPTDTH